MRETICCNEGIQCYGKLLLLKKKKRVMILMIRKIKFVLTQRPVEMQNKKDFNLKVSASFELQNVRLSWINVLYNRAF